MVASGATWDRYSITACGAGGAKCYQCGVEANLDVDVCSAGLTRVRDEMRYLLVSVDAPCEVPGSSCGVVSLFK